jgi:hypothetical protein
MILREPHSIDLAAIHPSRQRATACNADVRFNSDGGTHNAHSMVRDPSRFPPETEAAAPAHSSPYPC